MNSTLRRIVLAALVSLLAACASVPPSTQVVVQSRAIDAQLGGA